MIKTLENITLFKTSSVPTRLGLSQCQCLWLHASACVFFSLFWSVVWTVAYQNYYFPFAHSWLSHQVVYMHVPFWLKPCASLLFPHPPSHGKMSWQCHDWWGKMEHLAWTLNGLTQFLAMRIQRVECHTITYAFLHLKANLRETWSLASHICCCCFADLHMYKLPVTWPTK